ncbi:uncharacterized protein HKW66_Vig0098170 [Vigna angularis]|uniref:Uncharacterized protein n=1 Tax=Phaseolus angularis TaxID=3914 RepID=A0A8T0KMP0_PHAAN|nr:uncharacterized protein HKW66_Vig0098170 [Vigna angularis]
MTTMRLCKGTGTARGRGRERFCSLASLWRRMSRFEKNFVASVLGLTVRKSTFEVASSQTTNKFRLDGSRLLGWGQIELS